MAASAQQQQLLCLIFLLVFAASSSPAAVLGGGEHDLTHIHLNIHETRLTAGPNATATTSPLGANSSFGSVGVIDDELRVTPDRSSPLIGRYQAIFVGTSLEEVGYLTSGMFAFTAGEHAGSSLAVHGPILDSGGGVIERAVVGGTGKLRMARGYWLTKILPSHTPETAIFEVHVFVLLHHPAANKF